MDVLPVFIITFYSAGLLIFGLMFSLESEFVKEPLWMKISMTILWPLMMLVMGAGWLWYKITNQQFDEFEPLSKNFEESKSYRTQKKIMRKQKDERQV